MEVWAALELSLLLLEVLVVAAPAIPVAVALALLETPQALPQAKETMAAMEHLHRHLVVVAVEVHLLLVEPN